MRNISDKFCRISKIHILFLITFFFENNVANEIMQKNAVEPDRSQMTIKCGACALITGYLRLRTHTQNM